MKNCVAQIMLLSKEQDRAATGVLLGFGKAIKNRNEPEYLSVAICNERQADCVSLEMSKYNWTINIQVGFSKYTIVKRMHIIFQVRVNITYLI